METSSVFLCPFPGKRAPERRKMEEKERERNQRQDGDAG